MKVGILNPKYRYNKQKPPEKFGRLLLFLYFNTALPFCVFCNLSVVGMLILSAVFACRVESVRKFLPILLQLKKSNGGLSGHNQIGICAEYIFY